jgi:hypothetical protein
VAGGLAAAETAGAAAVVAAAAGGETGAEVGAAPGAADGGRPVARGRSSAFPQAKTTSANRKTVTIWRTLDGRIQNEGSVIVVPGIGGSPLVRNPRSRLPPPAPVEAAATEQEYQYDDQQEQVGVHDLHSFHAHGLPLGGSRPALSR